MPIALDNSPTKTSRAGQTGTNIGLSDAQRAALTPDEIATLEFGTKCNLAGWLMYTTLIWSLKACMLFFYARLTYARVFSASPMSNIKDES